MEKKTDMAQGANAAEDTAMQSQTSQVLFQSTGIDWTADGTDNAGWTTKSYTEL